MCLCLCTCHPRQGIWQSRRGSVGCACLRAPEFHNHDFVHYHHDHCDHKNCDNLDDVDVFLLLNLIDQYQDPDHHIYMMLFIIAMIIVIITLIILMTMAINLKHIHSKSVSIVKRVVHPAES